MKHQNLQILLQHNLPVPPFTVVQDGQSIDLSFSDAELFAVRSSFDAEDDKLLSFAGQFDTFLNVKTDEVEDAVCKVRSSYKKQNVQDYIRATGQASAENGSVIIQEMVDASLSGVIFTANPIGILNETVITVGKGLGDRVVEDRTETTSYYFNVDDGVYICQQQDGAPLLSDELLNRLLEISRHIKQIFQYKADIEFAIKDNEPYILQVRPITTLPDSAAVMLDNSNIVESYPGVSLPLTQDFVKLVYHNIFKNCIYRLTNDKTVVEQIEPCIKNMVDVADWRIYYRINNWYEMLRLLPFSSSIIPMWQGMLGVNNTDVHFPLKLKTKNRTKAKILLNFIKFLINTPKLMDGLNQGFAERYQEYRSKIHECQSVNEYLDLFYYIHDNVLINWDITLINDMYTFIFTALSGKNNNEQIANIRNLESIKPPIAMNELINLAHQKGIDSEEYIKAESDYIDLYGDRCLGELKMETKTYRTNPEILREHIQNKLPVDYDRSEQIKVRNPFVKRAKIGIQNREISRMNRSRLYGIGRDIFLGIGEILVKNGQMDRAEDIFYLYMDELKSSDDLTKTVELRKNKESVFRNMPTFSRLTYAENIIDHSIIGQGKAVLFEHILTGISSSVGIVEGEVLVIEQPDYSIDTTGKILVARSTDPGWVFLLQNASGIIAERGSLLSHTAIISRELHKPAIVNVKDCTKLLHNGDKVRLNAFDGTVTIL